WRTLPDGWRRRRPISTASARRTSRRRSCSRSSASTRRTSRARTSRRSRAPPAYCTRSWHVARACWRICSIRRRPPRPPRRPGEVRMQVRLDGTDVEVPTAATLAELLEGIAPHIEPSRLVTQVEVDGTAADPTDDRALSAWRLAGAEGIRVDTETPDGF